MEFYSCLRRRKSYLQEVSIPNGIEFYIRLPLMKMMPIGVSIPNGMEFYDDLTAGVLTTKLFQFPTGWNSTALAV